MQVLQPRVIVVLIKQVDDVSGIVGLDIALVVTDI